MVRFKKICEILPSSTKLSGFNTPKKNRLLQLQNAFLKHLGPKKTQPSARILEKFGPPKVAVFSGYPELSLRHPRDIFQRKTVSRNHANSGKSSILRGNFGASALQTFPRNKQTLAGGWAIFRGRFPVKKFRNVYYGLFLFSAPVIHHLEGPKRSYITFIYNIYSEEFEWLESMEMSTKRWPAWGLCSILWNQSCKRCLVENT